jgi:class 3 adenylate cyclase
VNKLIGDGLMATFGAPLTSGRDALNAIEAARKIYNYLKTFNDVRPEVKAAVIPETIQKAAFETASM